MSFALLLVRPRVFCLHPAPSLYPAPHINSGWSLTDLKRSTALDLLCTSPDTRNHLSQVSLVPSCVDFKSPGSRVRLKPISPYIVQARHRMCVLTDSTTKNVDKNPVAEKAIRELEEELLRHDPLGGSVTSLTLSAATALLNSRLRSRGLTAREMLTQRDQLWTDFGQGPHHYSVRPTSKESSIQHVQCQIKAPPPPPPLGLFLRKPPSTSVTLFTYAPLVFRALLLVWTWTLPLGEYNVLKIAVNLCDCVPSYWRHRHHF